MKKFASNSYLSILKRRLYPRPESIDNGESLMIYNQFRTAVLWPHKYNADNTPNWTGHIEHMVKAIRENFLFITLLYNQETKTNWEIYKRCKRTGVMTMIKVDVWNTKTKTIGDIRPTSARTKGEFIESIKRADGFRKAALSMDMSGAKIFTFFGVQKKYPYSLFTVTYTVDEDEINSGREEYIYLLRTGISYGELTTNFKP